MQKELTFIDKGFNQVYVTIDGKIISYRSGKRKIMKSFENTGYYYIKLWNRRKKKAIHLAIHRLVAMAFIPNPHNKETVNHIDRNKNNNHVDNLEWMTIKENVDHAENGLRNNKHTELWVGGQLIDTFESKAQACRYASKNYGVGRYSLEKYGKSGQVLIKRCND